jgi:uncharacterized protein (DUF1330 family)
MGSIEPTQQQLQALLASTSEGPIVMVNLLRFAEQASYPDGFDAEPCTGVEAYTRYAAAAQHFLEKVGGAPIWGAPAQSIVIGPSDEAWDVAFCVRYPSRQAFVDMALDPDYLAITPHRTAALADSRLIMCDAADNAPEMFGVPAPPSS